MDAPGTTILVVEDDGDIRDAVCEILAEVGYSVVCARNGAEALNYLTTTSLPPKLILLDLVMPEMDGWDFRSRQKQTARINEIPVVAFTASDRLKDGVAIDAAEVLTKPINVTALISTVRRHVPA